eukprot:9450386-Pyramimonas_sp.AAC.1
MRLHGAECCSTHLWQSTTVKGSKKFRGYAIFIRGRRPWTPYLPRPSAPRLRIDDAYLALSVAAG